MKWHLVDLLFPSLLYRETIMSSHEDTKNIYYLSVGNNDGMSS